ncbi:type II toxin-antitoxin system HicA family toxin [Clavibacter michiganensis]|uniref:Toxin HicA n=1 Tax=Clavibacter michiganensis subsp. insidiosus TaxID=33014 RepID=A0A0D5CMY6_9MICO|nr:type II toxin-antitoxin system HicA family toxin [Clavibacter michiganensis]AJW80630.1 toxin HicA [Clavibacter michiganensis subsp. insidiosus]AWF99812.1 toxin HicA [Clavibacter michiganensis subsp. insidiosus]AWG02916.1 toxin HicA [Clavibacter michiganensis subsp. insidiosus]OQJ56852.1 toxin HicA [Clavibacter michiganensis subsp. insidiosus]RII88819.1 type II toxin-antitoxin system HicA family toxin [Clavibacter michiganensis subsp. insidiosus]
MKPQKSRDVRKFLESIGWVFIRPAKGSHQIWGTPDESVKLSVPFGHKEVQAGILTQLQNLGVQVPKEWK